MIRVNQNNFSVRTMEKRWNSATASKDTFYADFRICFVLEGEAVWEIEDRTYPIREGDIVFLSLGQKRHFHSFGKDGFKLCIFTFERNAFFGLHHFLFFMEHIKSQSNVIRSNRLCALLREICEEWQEEMPLRYELASAKLTEFFIKAERQEQYCVKALSEKHCQMLEVMDYIDANIANAISLQSAAKKAGMTQSTFSRHFSQVNGISFKQYVVEKKIQRAILLLRSGDRKMIDVAMDSGFDSISGFYNAFRNKTGTTPSKYCEQL